MQSSEQYPGAAAGREAVAVEEIEARYVRQAFVVNQGCLHRQRQRAHEAGFRVFSISKLRRTNNARRGRLGLRLGLFEG